MQEPLKSRNRLFNQHVGKVEIALKKFILTVFHNCQQFNDVFFLSRTQTFCPIFFNTITNTTSNMFYKPLLGSNCVHEQFLSHFKKIKKTFSIHNPPESVLFHINCRVSFVLVKHSKENAHSSKVAFCALMK